MLVLKSVLAGVNGLLLCVLVALMITHVQSQNKIKSWSTAFHLVPAKPTYHTHHPHARGSKAAGGVDVADKPTTPIPTHPP